MVKKITDYSSFLRNYSYNGNDGEKDAQDYNSCKY